MVRWWWFGAAVEKPELLHELQQMKTDGIGGAELAFVYPEVLDNPSKNLKNLPFLSPEMLDAVHYAQAEGRLGLRIDVTLCSGWPYGGPATTLAEAASRLRFTEVPVPANATSITPPPLEAGETFISASLFNLLPAASPPAPCGFAYSNVCGAPSISPPTLYPPARDPNPPPPITWDPASVQQLKISGPTIPISPSNSLRGAIFFIASHTKQQVKRAAVGAEGYVLDPFSHEAVATHLQKVGEPLVKAFGDTPPYAIFSDSLEAYGADWTPTLPAEFQKRRGYDLLPHLPELVAGGTPAAEKVRHDWGQTLTELVNENYLTQINNWSIAHHTKFRSQTYGEPAVSFSSQRLAALPEGEGPQWRAFSTLRWATSANHVFNNNVTSGETFTWLHSPVFRATPLDMKAEADIDFIMGENQLIFHGWPYSPPPGKVPEPGWSLYAAAVFDDHNPWHPVMPDVTRYLQRISWLLRQGQPANQVAILLPTDDAWASFTPAHVTVTGAMQKLITTALMSAILSAGYNVDYIDADAINSVGLGTHQILVLPPTDRIPIETLRKIHTFAENGGKVVAVGQVPTQDPEGNSSPEIAEISKAIMLVPNTGELTKALDNVGNPDFKLTTLGDYGKESFGFIRRKLPNVDVYFVANTSNHPMDATVTFATAYQYGEQWDPDTVSSIPIPSANLSLFLNPYESKIFVFSSTAPKPSPEFLEYNDEMNRVRAAGYLASPLKHVPQTHLLADLSTDWQITFTSTKETVTGPTLTDWTSDPASLYYSGEAVYSRDFTVNATPKTPAFLDIDGGKAIRGAPDSPPEHPALGPNGLPDPRVTRTGPGMRAWYDPPIHEAAIVFLNGQRAGSLWHPPYRLDVSKLLKPGENHIEIHVYNTALNAWSALPPHDYKPLIERYGDRFQMQDLDKVQPIPSGLLGTIHLVTEETQ